LRREGRRIDAREQLRTAHEMLLRNWHERIRRASPARAGRYRRESAQPRRGDAKRPHSPGGSDRTARVRWSFQSGDRRSAIPEPAHRRVAHAQGIREARDQVSSRARRDPCYETADDPATRTCGWRTPALNRTAHFDDGAVAEAVERTLPSEHMGFPPRDQPPTG
jgi:hypothetical protein